MKPEAFRSVIVISDTVYMLSGIQIWTLLPGKISNEWTDTAANVKNFAVLPHRKEAPDTHLYYI
jgi:ribonuclease HI